MTGVHLALSLFHQNLRGSRSATVIPLNKIKMHGDLSLFKHVKQPYVGILVLAVGTALSMGLFLGTIDLK